MIALRGRVRRAATAAAAAVLLLSSGCSDSDADSSAPATTTPGVSRDLASYDAFVLASEENDPLFADVYGLRFDPLIAERITTVRRISTLSADDEHVAVAAADGDADRLALVEGDGSLVPVPGLGRPYAFAPVLHDGVLHYEAPEVDTDARRFLAFDLAKRKRTVVGRSTTLAAPYPLASGAVLYNRVQDVVGAPTTVVLKSTNGKARELSFGVRVYGGGVGAEWTSGTINAADNRFGDKPEALILLNLKTGKTKRIDGFQDVCWSPDGTRLLARRVGDPRSSPLVLIDPESQEVTEVGTVPGLAIYSGTWVRGGVRS
ncbi:hypothetical protein GCM10009547_09400 [Sporichthya brevicatena]|uniref:Uncharacterized protein n=1 Tax=Sporichthya brevicatena TaxID=171442 RepID=A0ABN1GDX0_9ACTN